jgi:carbon monoxide dehydrogenase subunit G
MKVVIEKVFPLTSTADSAWQCLQDIEAVGGCMPGAKITERVDATHFKGTVTVRVGPATMSFKGNIEVLDLDAAERTLHLIGKGSDSTGTSGASMDLVATVRASGASCELTGKSEVSMSGKAAAFGGRMMNTVADQILKQFVANFAALAEGVSASGEPAPEAAAITDAAAATASRAAPAQAAAPAAELNGLALAWDVIRDWLRGLFSRKTA